MAQSGQLRLSDVRDVFRLLGECRDLRHDADAWRAHMLAGLRQLTGAQVALYLHLHDIGSSAERLDEPMDSGFVEPWQRALWAHYQRERAYADDPFHCRFYAGFTGAQRTRSLSEVVDMPAWQRSRHYNQYIRVCRLEDRITSSVRVPGVAPMPTQVIVLHRAAGDGPFPARATKIVRLLHQELVPLLDGVLRLPGQEEERLPPQLAHVLACLLEGDAEKQVAARLALSPHTVNRHVQRLYRRFGVHSRAELMSRYRDLARHAIPPAAKGRDDGHPG